MLPGVALSWIDISHTFPPSTSVAEAQQFAEQVMEALLDLEATVPDLRDPSTWSSYTTAGVDMQIRAEDVPAALRRMEDLLTALLPAASS